MPFKITLAWVFLLLFGELCATAQTIHKHVLPRPKHAQSPGRNTAPTKRLVYELDALSTPARGLLVLLPGRGEPAKDVFRASSLAKQAAQQGFVVLVPALNDRRYLDSASIHFLDDAIAMVIQRQPALVRQLIIGGFSAGGQLAFTYAEKLLQDTTRRPWRVRAVLGVDPPLDLTEHWQRAAYHLAKQDCNKFRADDQNTLRELTRDMGGSPAEFTTNYLTKTAFLRSDPAGGNAQWLKTLSVRLYCEPDLLFWQQQYCPALEAADFNAEGAAALVSCLQRQGNKQAHYIQTTGKGFIGKQRMPHSWSIVDAVECVEWLKHCLL